MELTKNARSNNQVIGLAGVNNFRPRRFGDRGEFSGSRFRVARGRQVFGDPSKKVPCHPCQVGNERLNPRLKIPTRPDALSPSTRRDSSWSLRITRSKRSANSTRGISWHRPAPRIIVCPGVTLFAASEDHPSARIMVLTIRGGYLDPVAGSGWFEEHWWVRISVRHVG